MNLKDKDLETRILNLDDVELELREDDGKPPVLRGYAAVFNRASHDLGGFKEVVDPAAFNRALKQQQDVVALVDHDPSKLLGRSKSGTLRMMADQRGLLVEVDLPDTSIGRDVAVSIRRKDITGMSFGFRAKKDEWGKDGNNYPMRTLKDVDLVDVSPTVFPAYPNTVVAVRSLAQINEQEVQEQGDKVALLKAKLRLTEIESE